MDDKTVLLHAGLPRHAPQRIAHGRRCPHARAAAARDASADQRDRTLAAATLP